MGTEVMDWNIGVSSTSKYMEYIGKLLKISLNQCNPDEIGSSLLQLYKLTTEGLWILKMHLTRKKNIIDIFTRLKKKFIHNFLLTTLGVTINVKRAVSSTLPSCIRDYSPPIQAQCNNTASSILLCHHTFVHRLLSIGQSWQTLDSPLLSYMAIQVQVQVTLSVITVGYSTINTLQWRGNLCL